MEQAEVIVIGGGAAGLMAAYQAAKRGKSVILLEKNEKLGKKIYITGKGRCNFTNDCPPDDFLSEVVSNAKFLNGAIRSFPPAATMKFFEQGGMNYKIERGNRAFPVSDHASDVTKTFERYLQSVHVDVRLNETVMEINTMSDNGNSMFDIITSERNYQCEKVIIATGGLSYPSTGSTGDGYSFAKKMGHSIVPCVPALVGLNTKDNFKPLQGLSLKNVTLSVFDQQKMISSQFGEMLFTHFGISGPIVLTTSSLINRKNLSSLKFFLDLKPALSEEQLDARLIREFEAEPNKTLSNVMVHLLPKNLIPFVIKQSGVDSQKQVNSVTKDERRGLISSLKSFIINVSSLCSVNEAIVTAGGVSVKEINPRTMESKLCKNVFFCGEVLDLDAFTGGFNLQIAFATGYAAGNAV